MQFTCDEIAVACNGTLNVGSERTDPARVIQGVSVDSREVQPGQLFVPMVAERDGHLFIDAALERGATAWLTQVSDSRPGAIHVANTAIALADLGRAARVRLQPMESAIIGVTGSSGKTSTKDLIRGVLLSHGPAGASEKSFNNEMGVPLTLCNTPDGAWATVLEMGARGSGHIAYLCSIARPTVGVITNVGTAHQEMYDKPDGIRQAKGELIESLPASGTAVLNADDPSHVHHSAATIARVLTFSALTTGADLFSEAVTLDEELRPSFTLHSPWGTVPVRLGARGLHQVSNALAAAGAALSVGVSLDELQHGLATESLSPWRMEFGRTPSGAVVVNDAYNANDKSMEVALRALAGLSAQRRIAVLGTMAELGDLAAEAHTRMIAVAREIGIDLVIAVNEPRYIGADIAVGSVGEAHECLQALNLQSSDAVLVKGSRSTGMERVAFSLLSPPSTGSHSALSPQSPSTSGTNDD
jgi:UDP-N-acetylmuramoyl-tripeptide--D-alanyl-D-alanine ligase